MECSIDSTVLTQAPCSTDPTTRTNSLGVKSIVFNFLHHRTALRRYHHHQAQVFLANVNRLHLCAIRPYFAAANATHAVNRHKRQDSRRGGCICRNRPYGTATNKHCMLSGQFHFFSLHHQVHPTPGQSVAICLRLLVGRNVMSRRRSITD